MCFGLHFKKNINLPHHRYLYLKIETSKDIYLYIFSQEFTVIEKNVEEYLAVNHEQFLLPIISEATAYPSFNLINCPLINRLSFTF